MSTLMALGKAAFSSDSKGIEALQGLFVKCGIILTKTLELPIDLT